MSKEMPPRSRGFVFVVILLVLAVMAMATCDASRTLGYGVGLPKEVPPCAWALR